MRCIKIEVEDTQCYIKCEKGLFSTRMLIKLQPVQPAVICTQLAQELSILTSSLQPQEISASGPGPPSHINTTTKNF